MQCLNATDLSIICRLELANTPAASALVQIGNVRNESNTSNLSLEEYIKEVRRKRLAKMLRNV